MIKPIASILLITLGISAGISSQASPLDKKKKGKAEKRELHAWEVDTLIKGAIPINRQVFTDRVQKQIQQVDLKDGEVDKKVELEDESASAMYSNILREANQTLIHIENLNVDHQVKIAYHRALESALQKINLKSFTINNAHSAKKLLDNFRGLLVARETNTVEEFVNKNANIYTLDNSALLDEYPVQKSYLFEQMAKAKPEMMIKKLSEFANEPYADPVIKEAAKSVPGIILNYAKSTNYKLSNAVRRSKDPLVQSIVRIATESREPLKTLPFLGAIHAGKMTVREADATVKDNDSYFKALVQLKVDNEQMGVQAIDDEIKYRGLKYVRLVNELHDAAAPVRFKSLMNFSAEDLYFMMIGSQDELYTSSFVWMFNRMKEKMAPLKGDEFLNKVHKYHFRSFIRMCAGYNTLSPFLATIESSNRSTLMKEFVAGLEKGSHDDLEDAVDVADAFGSVKDAELASFLKDEIRSNYERCYKLNNAESTKGVIVYGLLSTIFNEGSTADIPPITFVPYNQLKDSANRVVEVVFFYGDKDGMGAFSNFIRNYTNNNWKHTRTKYWVEIKSTKSKDDFYIFANVPLDEHADVENDAKAQQMMLSHLDKQGMQPTILIHRGHSYYVPTTLSYVAPSNKVVVLGSCGGYHNLSTVLETAEDAHIISSKQTGALSVNMPIINEINTAITGANDINWIELWRKLDGYFANRSKTEKDYYSDYVPPNKNLGAIFIKAYKRQVAKLADN